MIRLKELMLGAVVFIAVHLVLETTWQSWFQGGGGHAAWFMNSGASVAFTAGAFAVVNLMFALVNRTTRINTAAITVLNVAAGATVPMIITLFRLPGGPGNLFPIAIAIGILILLGGGAVGATLGWVLRSAGGPRTRPTG